MAEREGEKPRERGFANQRGSAQKLGTPLGDGCVRGHAAAVCPLHIPPQPGRGAPNAPGAGGAGGQGPPKPLHPSGCPVRTVPGAAGPLRPGGGRAGTAGERPGAARGLRGGCAGGRGCSRGPGTARPPTSPANSAFPCGAAPSCPRITPHTPPDLPGHSGRTQTPVNLQSSTAPPVQAETPHSRRPGGDARPSRARAPARSRAAEPRAGPGARMRVSRAGGPGPGRARLSPPPARRPSGPGSPAGAAPPARGSGRRPGPPRPPPQPARRPRHRPLGPAGFGPFPEKGRAAPREFRFVRAGKLPRAGSPCSLPAGRRAAAGMRGRCQRIHRIRNRD
ncbi:translation initiation factor IF-2-like [Motacilla alba alba]|uniref:translation initiation factor IF-2-like n=1 Tax=Motacilla alba alba TaxID=1094192 RepID=UPI0018D53B73|nr:translation initiation factor IF-2-like [Motacilla alba alba]